MSRRGHLKWVRKIKELEMMRDKKPSNQSPLAQCFEFIIPFEKVFHRSTTLLIDSSSTTHWGKKHFLSINSTLGKKFVYY